MIWNKGEKGSHLKFVATLEGRQTTGEFPDFTTMIYFDPARLGESRVDVVIDMKNIVTSYPDVAANLVKKDWFDVARFPITTFKGQEFKSRGGRRYEVTGALTLRDVTQQETLEFTLIDYGSAQAHIVGRMKINRLDYGVGQGDWSAVSFVADEVLLEVEIKASR